MSTPIFRMIVPDDGSSAIVEDYVNGKATSCIKQRMVVPHDSYRPSGRLCRGRRSDTRTGSPYPSLNHRPEAGCLECRAVRHGLTKYRKQKNRGAYYE